MSNGRTNPPPNFDPTRPLSAYWQEFFDSCLRLGPDGVPVQYTEEQLALLRLIFYSGARSATDLFRLMAGSVAAGLPQIARLVKDNLMDEFKAVAAETAAEAERLEGQERAKEGG